MEPRKIETLAVAATLVAVDAKRAGNVREFQIAAATLRLILGGGTIPPVLENFECLCGAVHYGEA